MPVPTACSRLRTGPAGTPVPAGLAPAGSPGSGRAARRGRVWRSALHPWRWPQSPARSRRRGQAGGAQTAGWPVVRSAAGPGRARSPGRGGRPGGAASVTGGCPPAAGARGRGQRSQRAVPPAAGRPGVAASRPGGPQHAGAACVPAALCWGTSRTGRRPGRAGAGVPGGLAGRAAAGRPALRENSWRERIPLSGCQPAVSIFPAASGARPWPPAAAGDIMRRPGHITSDQWLRPGPLCRPSLRPVSFGSVPAPAQARVTAHCSWLCGGGREGPLAWRITRARGHRSGPPVKAYDCAHFQPQGR